MTNVLPFTKQSSVLSKAAPQMTQWFIENGAPELISNLFLHLVNDRVRTLLRDNILDNVSYGLTPENDKHQMILFLKTVFRPNLVPEFGTQDNLDFFRIVVMPYPDDLEPSPFPTEDKGLMQQACNYFDSYAEVNSNLTAFCYQLIEAVLVNNQFEYVNVNLSDIPSMTSKFTFGVIDSKRTNLYLFVIDFLPILLDNNAVQYWSEKIQPNQGD